MRRLIGLIALAALIYAAVWMIQNDFNLRKVPILSDVINEIAGPAPDDVPGSAPADGADATASSANQAVSGADATSANTTDAAANTSSGGEATSSATETGDVAATDQAMGTAADAGTEAAPPVEGPTFDIIRVEPSGEAVIAGLAAPRAKVEILNRDEPVATAEANERGEWALELSEPLPPGTHDLAIRATSEDGSEVTHSHQRVAVSVPQSSDEEPLVVLNQPDAPSRIVQVPAEGDQRTTTRSICSCEASPT